MACKKNRIKVVELLLRFQANLEAATESGLTSLHVSAFMGHQNIVLLLLQTGGASPNAVTQRGETPLHLAARANQLEIVRILLRHGAHVDAKAKARLRPPHRTAPHRRSAPTRTSTFRFRFRFTHTQPQAYHLESTFPSNLECHAALIGVLIHWHSDSADGQVSLTFT